jgi:hypothetical protein
MSAGVKGLRGSIGSRGIGISGGRKGIYFRKTLSSGRTLSASFVKIANSTVEPAAPTPKEKRDAHQLKKAENPLNAGGYPLAITLAIVAAFSLLIAVLTGLASLSAGAFGMFWVVFWSLLAALAFWMKSGKIKKFKRHEAALSRLTHNEDPQLLTELGASFTGLSRIDWEARHRSSIRSSLMQPLTTESTPQRWHGSRKSQGSFG